MPVTMKMVASEVLMCGVKFGLGQIPVVGPLAATVVDNLQKRHEALSNTARMAEFEAQLKRVDRAMRDTVEGEIRKVLANLGRSNLPGPELTREMIELRAIHEQGWSPNLFEGLLRNSTHWEELRRNPHHYGRVLRADEPVNAENGMHLLIEKDTTRILELPASSLAFLLSNQSVGIPAAEVRAAQDIWAFPTQQAASPRVIAPPPFERTPQIAVPSQPARTFVNSLGMTMVRIEAGTFKMGSNDQENEKPRHEVRITKAFSLGAHPVTQGQYLTLMGKNPSHFKDSDDLPVETVSWNEAVDFCNELSERENREYRLPTEAEWEYACRAGSTTRFPFGDRDTELGQYAWFNGNSSQKTHPVGSKKPNPWGLYDMLGNVWEWCQDGYDEAYYKKSPLDDPPGAGAASRVIRGGSWYAGPGFCRSASRSAFAPEYRNYFLGFRLAAVQD